MFLCAVTQLNDIKRQKVRLEAMKKEAEEERERVRQAARERVLQEFERGQLGLAASSVVSTTSGLDSSECTSPCPLSHLCLINPTLFLSRRGRIRVARGTKRKFDFDASAVETLAREAEEAALEEMMARLVVEAPVVVGEVRIERHKEGPSGEDDDDESEDDEESEDEDEDGEERKVAETD